MSTKHHAEAIGPDVWSLASTSARKGEANRKGEEARYDELTSPFERRSASTPFGSTFAHRQEAGLVPLPEADCLTSVRRAVATHAGLPDEPDEPGQWVLAGHPIRARWWVDHDRRSVLIPTAADWPEPPAPGALLMAQVFAATVMGEARIPVHAELSPWRTRMLVELGFVPAATVGLPTLPPGAPAAAAATWRQIAELLKIRRVDDPAGTLTPLSAPWFARWSGLRESTIASGKSWLEAQGYLMRAGTAPSGFPKPMILWRILGDEDPAESLI